MSSAQRVSIIIPTLNEAGIIGQTLSQLKSLDVHEILVVDGGSTDETILQCEQADRVIYSKPGRAIQQNRGAQEATGEILLFLHADCWLRPDAVRSIRHLLENPNTIAGCFRQQIPERSWCYRLLEWGNRQRVIWLQWAYGDQGLFIKKEVFQQMGGFPELSLMEDLYLMKTLSRQGRIVVSDEHIITSARRWKQAGVWGQTLRNWWLIVLVHLGVSTDRLLRFYPPVR